MLDDGGSRSDTDRSAVGRRQREQLRETAGQIGGIARIERHEVSQCRWIRGLEPGGHFREPRVTRNERRTTCGRRLRSNHSEGLGEDRRHDARVGECQQVAEVAVLERPGEDCVDSILGRPPLERRTLRAEPDDDEPGFHAWRARR